jgi:hypothetical protein
LLMLTMQVQNQLCGPGKLQAELKESKVLSLYNRICMLKR